MSLEKYQSAFKNSLLITSFILIAAVGRLTAQPIGLSIKQGADTYNVLELDSVILKPKPFKYLVRFPSDKDIRLNQSYTDSLYKEFKQGNIKQINYWGAHCMAETSFNSDKEILLDPESWSCWFYKDKLDFHRLDAKSIRVKEDYITATKSVIAFYSDSKNVVQIRRATRPIYLVIAAEANIPDEVAYFHCCKIIFKR